MTRTKTKPRPKTKKGALGWGARHMAKILKGYGGFPRPIIHSKAKTSTKIALTFTCSGCSKKTYKQHPIRAKKLEQV